MTEILLFPAKVQGNGAAEEVASRIREANGRTDLDVLIIGRGGGAIEDLWAFNEEIVVRTIFESRIPVISSVGHETDTTLADFLWRIDGLQHLPPLQSWQHQTRD